MSLCWGLELMQAWKMLAGLCAAAAAPASKMLKCQHAAEDIDYVQQFRLRITNSIFVQL